MTRETPAVGFDDRIEFKCHRTAQKERYQRLAGFQALGDWIRDILDSHCDELESKLSPSGQGRGGSGGTG